MAMQCVKPAAPGLAGLERIVHKAAEPASEPAKLSMRTEQPEGHIATTLVT
jgi:hypothetical protein